jgi:predicted secreted acid phosphatase
MKKTKIFVLTALSSLTLSAYALEPQNIDCSKKSVIQYYTSGQYEKDVDRVVTKAEKYMFERIDQNNHASQPRKLAMVLDIDDTSLTNFEVNKVDDFSSLEPLIEKRYEKANSPAIKPVLRLYQEAVANGVSVFFITFRPQHVAAYTVTNLQNAGYRDWSGLYLASEDDVHKPSKIFKSATRNKIAAHGYDIILNLGDQPSDLEGDNSGELALKLPNPMYTSASNCIINGAVTKRCSN